MNAPPARNLMAVLLCAAALIAGCSGPTEADLLASARAHLDKRDAKAAVIELKNLLQAQPKSAPARLLLGQALLETGDAVGAETQLRRALDLGQPSDAVVPALAKVLAAQRRWAPMVEQFGTLELRDDRAATDLKVQIAGAYAALGNKGAAHDAIANGLRRSPRDLPARLLQARLAADRGELAAGRLQADALVEQEPRHAEAWLLKGDLALPDKPAAADIAAATSAYRKALALRADLLPAHVALIALLIRQEDFDGANRQWGELRKALPTDPQTRVFEAVLALHRGDAARARALTQELLRGDPDNARLLLLAGQAELRLGSSSQAEALLAKAVQMAPDAAEPRRSLARIHLRAGQAARALALLQPLLATAAPDAEALALAGQAQLMSGDVKAADASFARADKLRPADPGIRTSMALSRLAKGQSEAAFAELESIATADTGGTAAELAIVNSRLRRGEFDAALKAIDGLAAKRPNDPLPDYLRGRIALQRKDTARARKLFEATLAKDAGYFAAAASLAVLDLADRQPEAARGRMQALLKRDAKNVAALLALAEITARSGGGADDVTALLRDAIKADPRDPAPRIALVDQRLAAGDARAALSAAQEGVAALPAHPELIDRLGRTQAAGGDLNQAIATFMRLAALQPKSALPYLRLAEAHEADHRSDAADAAVRRAIELAPDALPVQRAAAALAMREKQPARAAELAAAMQARHPDAAAGYIVEGDLRARQRDWPAAAAAFRKAMTKANADEAVGRLHYALTALKQNAEADRIVDAWLRAHPDDHALRLHLADAALARGEWVQAEARYRAVLEHSPDAVQALNNLAYLMVRQNKPGAVALAERAVRLAPDKAPLLDTLALGYAGERQLAKAIELQNRVVALAPEAGQYRLNLAKFYLQSGDKRNARAELDKLARLGAGFSEHAEVAQLLKALGSG